MILFRYNIANNGAEGFKLDIFAVRKKAQTGSG
jgi:hypothetical protein